MSRKIVALYPCKPHWLLYIPQLLAYQNSAFCPHSAAVCLYGSHNKERLFPQTALKNFGLCTGDVMCFL
jgi:hypothetical protein